MAGREYIPNGLQAHISFSDVKSYTCLKMEFPWGLNGPQAVSACVKDDWCLNLTCAFCTCVSISNICLKIHRLFPHSFCIGCIFCTFKTSSQSPEIADSKRRAAVPWALNYMIKKQIYLIMVATETPKIFGVAY